MPTPNVDLDALRESQDRALYREGIPMFVVLSDERGDARPVEPDPLQPNDDLVQSNDERLAKRMDDYRRSLAADQRDTDMGVLLSVLAVTAYEDFDRSVTA